MLILPMVRRRFEAGDGNDSFTKALLHMNGSDASTTFTDDNSGGSAKTWTANGNAQIDTAESKFGGASGLFDGTGDYIDTPDHADFDVGSGDFTVDFWVRRNATGRMATMGQSNSGFAASSISFEFNASNQLKLTLYYNSGASAVSETGATLTDTSGWHHIALIRDGNTLYTALDGTLSSGTSVTGITVDNASNKWAIGRDGEYASLYFNGWIDEFRFSKGIARWTANFTPPTSAYS